MVSKKYIRLKNRNGHVVDWTPAIHIVPEDMEVFESDVPPPERIANLVDWKVSLIDQKAKDAVAKRAAKAES